MHRKQKTTDHSTQSASSVSHSDKKLRRYLSFRPVAVLAAAAAALLTTGLAAGTAVTAAGAVSTPHATSHTLATTGLGYTPLASPVRIADTRAGATDPATYAGKTLSGGGSLTIDIPASAALPSTASAIVVNLSAINPGTGGFLTAYPGGGTLPLAANLTFVKGQTVSNLVTVGLGADATSGSPQSFTVYDGPTVGGTVDFTADLEGYYSPQTATSGGALNSVGPTRLYDSRTGSGEPGAGTTLTAGHLTDDVQVTGGSTGVPTTATAVVLSAAITGARK